MSILVISNHNSVRVLFDKIVSVYFVWKKYLYYSIGCGQPREPGPCQLYRRTSVPYNRTDSVDFFLHYKSSCACRTLCERYPIGMTLLFSVYLVLAFLLIVFVFSSSLCCFSSSLYCGFLLLGICVKGADVIWDLGASYFSIRVINVWNSLPADRVHFSSFAAFKQTIEQINFSQFLFGYDNWSCIGRVTILWLWMCFL